MDDFNIGYIPNRPQAAFGVLQFMSIHQKRNGELSENEQKLLDESIECLRNYVRGDMDYGDCPASSSRVDNLESIVDRRLQEVKDSIVNDLKGQAEEEYI